MWPPIPPADGPTVWSLTREARLLHLWETRDRPGLQQLCLRAMTWDVSTVQMRQLGELIDADDHEGLGLLIQQLLLLPAPVDEGPMAYPKIYADLGMIHPHQMFRIACS